MRVEPPIQDPAAGHATSPLSLGGLGLRPGGRGDVGVFWWWLGALPAACEGLVASYVSASVAVKFLALCGRCVACEAPWGLLLLGLAQYTVVSYQLL